MSAKQLIFNKLKIQNYNPKIGFGGSGSTAKHTHGGHSWINLD